MIVNSIEPLTPPGAVAVIVTLPAATPVTKPLLSTVATSSLLEDQVTAWRASIGATTALNWIFRVASI